VLVNVFATYFNTFRMKHPNSTWSILKPIAFLLAFMVIAHGADSDFDGLDDAVETNTGVFVSPSNTGTNPSAADSDGDGVPDGLEVKEKTSPVDAMKFYSFSKGMLAYWPFNGNATDETGRGNNGVPTNVIAVTDRMSNSASAYQFNGTSSTIRVPTSISAGKDLTFSFWSKIKPTGSGGSVIHRDNWRNGYLHCGMSATNISLGVAADSPQGYSIETLGEQHWLGGDWNHIVFVRSSIDMYCRFYINGKLVGQQNQSYLHYESIIAPLQIGAWIGLSGLLERFFEGELDDLRIFNRALSQSEVEALNQVESGQAIVSILTSNDGSISGSGQYQLGSSATLTAIPNPGYRFTEWTGDALGTSNPLTITMDDDKTVGATFVEDTRDSDFDGLTNFQEMVTYGSNPDLADTDGDGINDGAEVTQGRSPKVAEPVITNITATQRSGTKFVDISYDLASVTPTVKVTLEISKDGGLTYNVPVTSTTGAIGNGVTVGTGKTIAWNAGADWDGNFSNQMRFRLIADDLQVPGFSMIPAGAFTMGRTSGDTDTNAPPVNVTVSQFYMGKYEVTKAEWDEVRAWAVNNGYTDLLTGAGKASNHPVQTVSWWDVIKWCNARSQKEGLTPCYTVSGSVMKTGTTTPTVNWTANGYRLPTEAEWEKAARGGVSGKRFPWGTDTVSHANAIFNNVGGETYQSGTTGYHPTHATGSTPYTSPVGSFAANGYGLHDMAGNVWEWCWDWYGASTYVNNVTDPRGAASGSLRVSRGGSWNNAAVNNRAAYRGAPTGASSDRDGFRVARSNSVTLGVSNNTSPQNSTVDIRNFSLSKTTTTNGSISGNGSYLSGSSATVTATPQPGYLFGSWIGDASGSNNPVTLLMDADKTVGASFVEDTRDPDADGLTNYQEIIIRLTNPNLSDTDGDGINDSAEVQQSRNPTVAEAVVTNLVATQRTGTKFFDMSYDLASTTPSVKISLEISSDGGASYTVPVTSATGAIGEGVLVGTGKSIVWNAGTDWDAKLSTQMRFRLIADNQIIDGLSLIPAGSFTMGRTSGDMDTNAPPVTVNVSRFHMGKNEVTKALWDEVRTWALTNGYTDLAAGAGKASDHPVQLVSWWDVIKWCNARSQKEGLTPCYTVSGAVMKTGTIAPTVNWSANGYRLPTEAEWEKAARGGVIGKRFPWGTDTISHNQSNYAASISYSYDSSGAINNNHPIYNDGTTPYTSPVGSFAANGFGLNDMAGNVREWCWDWYGASTYVNGATDPRGAASGTLRLNRGGSWYNIPVNCRASDRDNVSAPTIQINDIGFRIARTSGLGSRASLASNNTNLDTRMWTLTSSTVVNGSISGAGSYLSQTSANLTASPLSGYLFGSWSGDASGSENPITILMDSNKTVGATFVEDTRDPDNDGLTNYQEIIIRLTNPNLADSDNDGVNDGQEVADTSDPLVADTDGDGLNDGEEKTRSTNPLLTDTDDDGYSDSYEVNNNADPNTKTSFPTYTLSLANNGTVTGGTFAKSGTLAHGTDATVTATPLSGYLFGSWNGASSGSNNPTTVLMNSNKTVGANFVEDTRDPDNDGLTNYQEIIIRLTNPNLSDSDNDGVKDGQEVTDTTNPLIADTDGDGLSDGEEKTRSTNPLVTDTDGDSYSDSYEVNNDADPTTEESFPTYTLTLTNNGTATGGTFAKTGTLAHGTNATVTATPLSGYLFGSWNGAASGSNNPTTVLMDAHKSVGATFAEDTRDPDADGLTNYQEIIIRLTNPDLADSDSDGVNDGQEVTDTTNPLVADSDGDGLNDGEEKTRSTNPLLTDTDDDGYSDSYEVNNNADPNTKKSFPTYTLTLTNNGNITGGTFAKSGTLAHGTDATVTATPLSGYLFDSWNGAASGSNNPTTVLMNSNKTVGATFVEDTRDPDNDGLTNYQEIIIRLTNPNLADSDNDGVKDGQEVTDTTNPLIADTDGDGLSDGEEKTRTTNPLVVDTDGDGLGDLQEITISQTNPLLSDTNGNGVNDALEDTDNDGILNGREVNQLGTNPLLADTNSDGLSDTYELLFQGNTEPFTPRVGDRVRYDLSQLGYQGTYKVVGTLPKGLTFNATTGILEGKLIGTAGTSKLTIQILNGKTVLRSIPLNIPVLAFPATLVGTWQTLLENQQDQPEGLLTVTITSPGTWSASYDGIGTRTIRKAKGSFDLTAAEEESSWSMTFPATSALPSGLPAVTMSFDIVGSTALAEGTHPRGTMRGFRLARGAELPAKTNTITMLIDQGEQDGFVIPAGMGWATGSISNRGAVALKGQLGDAQAITTTLSLGATGQALMWLKPYKNLNSYIGGIVSLHGSGVLPASPLHNQESGLWWYRAADATELGYSIGFAPMSASVGVRSHLVPASALALSQNLGLTEQVIRGVVFDGGGLPDPNATAKLPEAFGIDASYKMIAAPLPGQLMSPWTGLIASRTGGFTGTLKVVASNSDTIAGNAAVSGVLFPTVGSRVVGAGLVKIPIVGPKGAFRTGAIVLGTEEEN
jgi:uncharacterized repeat protein (TIGR02543 family)